MTTKEKLAGGKVRVSMSAEVANNLDAFKKGVIRFAEEIGCPKCFSGLDCTFESEREFVITKEFEVRRGVLPQDSVSRGAGTRRVTVPLSQSEEFNLETILDKIDILGKRIGPHWEQGGAALCCSGWDPTFGRETDIGPIGRPF